VPHALAETALGSSPLGESRRWIGEMIGETDNQAFSRS
jgi:hypothetical protein